MHGMPCSRHYPTKYLCRWLSLDTCCSHFWRE
uniref:Uncharacterized protein n=1 Tax=Rhizophora mucronata TaxID=61149 RepID=A0A2P2N583_RHIMU